MNVPFLNLQAQYAALQAELRPVMERTLASGHYILGPNVKGFENCKSVDEWDPNFPDENTAFYARRLDEFSEKFAKLFNPPDFRAIFSADDLFPFDPKGITVLITEAAEREPGGPDEPHASQLGIWLDEA
jgi:hypothetical protein